MDFDQCCRVIIVAGKDPKQVRQVDYAVNYAKAGLTMTDKKAMQVQAPYILNNITSWRSPNAKDVRSALKEFVR